MSVPLPPQPAPPPTEPVEPVELSATSQQLQQETAAAIAAAAAPSPLPTIAQLEAQQPAEEGEEEGVRAASLRKVFTRSLAQSISACSFDNFAKCFPTASRNQPTFWMAIHKQMVTHMEKRALAEYDSILAARRAVPLLNALDTLILAAEAEARPGVAPPVAPSMLPPAAVVDAHVTPLLRAAQDKVRGRLEETRARNDVLVDEITAQREEMRELVARLEEQRRMVEEAVMEVRGAVASGMGAE